MKQSWDGIPRKTRAEKITKTRVRHNPVDIISNPLIYSQPRSPALALATLHTRRPTASHPHAQCDAQCGADITYVVIL